MEPTHILIDQMASYICFQAGRLDEFRLEMFLNWLKSHSSAVRNAECAGVETEDPCTAYTYILKDGLKLWFEALPLSGLLWEYRLILTEIRWWRNLDEPRLVKIMLECLGHNS
jgi:hypothetical protein